MITVPAIKVTVRDGRVGRDSLLVDDEGGDVLMEYATHPPLHRGDRLTLLDGTDVKVIGVTARIRENGWFVTSLVSDS
jgi:hypothetical protein